MEWWAAVLLGPVFLVAIIAAILCVVARKFSVGFPYPYVATLLRACHWLISFRSLGADAKTTTFFLSLSASVAMWVQWCITFAARAAVFWRTTWTDLITMDTVPEGSFNLTLSSDGFGRRVSSFNHS
jgi:hypothetical protein